MRLARGLKSLWTFAEYGSLPVSPWIAVVGNRNELIPSKVGPDGRRACCVMWLIRSTLHRSCVLLPVRCVGMSLS